MQKKRALGLRFIDVGMGQFTELWFYIDYSTSALRYVGTAIDPTTGERTDEYQADVDGGTRVEIQLSKDGQIDVAVWSFMLH